MHHIFDGVSRGYNLSIEDGGQKATRIVSFGQGIAFSGRPIQPGELFLIEIVGTENGWSGDLRLGFTQLQPADIDPLPTYAMPDLVCMGESWVCAVSRRINWFEDNIRNWDVSELVNGAVLTTSYGSVPLIDLAPARWDSSSQAPLATDTGSRIGIYFELIREDYADLYLVVNGLNLGCWAQGVEIVPDKPMYAVVDVYGNTKAVRIVPLYSVPSLQHTCARAIMRMIRSLTDLPKLPLPKQLQSSLTHYQRCLPVATQS